MSHNKNYELGLHIHNLLKAQKLENPILQEYVEQWSNSEHLARLEVKLAEFLVLLGFDLSDSSLSKTPKRVVKFFLNELFHGLDYQNFPNISATDNDFAYTSPLISQGISVNSTCEHHLVAIQGKAIVAYMPTDKIVGLSKLNRVVDFFARRPQVQERMTRQIFVVLQEVLGTEDVAVAINATHNCIVTRGIEDVESETLTLETGGKFASDSVLKASFYQLATAMKSK